MRKSNETRVDSGIYARLQKLPMSLSDRRQALESLNRAEAIVGLMLWLKSKLADVGQAFLKPSLKN